MHSQRDDVRGWHYIARNTGCTSPGNLLFVDTETEATPIPGKRDTCLHTLKLWCAIHCRNQRGKISRLVYRDGATVESFWDMLDSFLSKSRPLWVFAHNIGFDLTTLLFWRQLETGRYVLKQGEPWSSETIPGEGPRKWLGFAVIDDPPTIIKVRKNDAKQTIIMVDTFNYFRSSLRELGDSVGIAKMIMPKPSEGEKALREYCFQDVEIIRHSVCNLISFCHVNNLGNFRYTTPSQAMSAFRHRFMSHRILVHGNKDCLALEREAYYGGRCQSFFLGEIIKADTDTDIYFGQQHMPYRPFRHGPVYVFDVQSFYPSVMADNKYPVRIIGSQIMPSHLDLRLKLTHYGVIARVRIKSHDETFPVHRNGRTFMANGKFTTSLCGPELQRALKHDCIQSIGVMTWYDMADIFTDYVDFFWQLRETFRSHKQTAYAYLCKLFLNSLFGKFGQRGRKWLPDEITKPPFPWGTWAEVGLGDKTPGIYRSIAWAVQRQSIEGESDDSIPAISAYVTSYGRERLNDMIRIAGVDNVHYVDTDALHVSQAGHDKLIESDIVEIGQLGKLHVVKVAETGEYRGPKDYTLDNDIVIAGIKHNAEQVRRGVFKQLSFQRLASILAGPPPDGVEVAEITIDRSQSLYVGKLLPDGRVLPVRLDE